MKSLACNIHPLPAAWIDRAMKDDRRDSGKKKIKPIPPKGVNKGRIVCPVVWNARAMPDDKRKVWHATCTPPKAWIERAMQDDRRDS